LLEFVQFVYVRVVHSVFDLILVIECILNGTVDFLRRVVECVWVGVILYPCIGKIAHLLLV